jgi:hypothetical protein
MANTAAISDFHARVNSAYRWVLLASASGVITGVVVGGLGSRIVMRIVGAMEGTLPRQQTDAGFNVGEISAFGIVVLVIISGAVTGIVGGIAYQCALPWLRVFGRWRGLVFGVVLLLTGGSLVIESANTDFVRLGSASVNIYMFAALFVVFGVVIAPAVDWMDSNLQFNDFASAVPARATLPFLLMASGGAVVAAVFSLFAFTGLLSSPVKVVIPALFLLLIPINRMMTPANDQGVATRKPRLFFIGYGVIALASVVGLLFGVQAVTEIQDCANSLSTVNIVPITESLVDHYCD